MDPFWKTRLKRRPLVLLCSIAASAAFCFLLCFLAGFIKKQQNELKTVQSSITISCVVSNIAGNRTTGLLIPAVYIDQLEHEEGRLRPYVRHIRLSKDFYYSTDWSKETETPEDPDKERKEWTGTVTALNSSDGVADLSEEFGRCVRFFEWYESEANRSISVDEFLAENEAVCILPSAVMNLIKAERHVELEGDNQQIRISLCIRDPYLNTEETVRFLAVGEYASDSMDLYIPWNFARELMNKMTGVVSCDSMRFSVKDNRLLPEMAEAAAEIFQQIDPADTGSEGNFALVIHDELYRSTLNELERNIARLRLMMPFLFLLILLIGFLSCMLATRTEEHSYALMRSQGISIRGVFASALAGQMLPGSFGAVTGAVLSKLFIGTSCFSALIILAIYLIFYLLGSCFAVRRVTKITPMKLLKKEES